jgi:hypothetical protein
MMKMHTPVQADPKAGRRFWLDHVKALAESGFSRKEYCRRHQLSYDCLTYWVRKHRSVGESVQLPALVEVRIPEQVGHQFRSNPATDSVSFRPGIPVESGH